MTDLEIMKHEKPLTSPELTVVERVPINLRPSHSSFHSSLHVILSYMYAWIACGLLVSARISISIATRPNILFIFVFGRMVKKCCSVQLSLQWSLQTKS